MSEKVKELSIQKEPNHLYFITKEGHVGKAKLSRAGRKKVSDSQSEVVVESGIIKEPGYLYFLDKDGDISRTEMARGRRKK
jgi:hypothetical protein